MPMAQREHEFTLMNGIEAGLISEILKEEGIPHYVRSYHDSAYDGIYQAQRGWGHIEASDQFHDQVAQIIADVRTREG